MFKLAFNNVFAVIVNWNLAEKTIACVNSLISSGLPLDHIIIVDNGSNDNSVESFYLKFGDLPTIIRNPNNKGFAGGANQGVLEAIKRNAEWIFLINNDAYVDKSFFSNIEKFLCEDYDIVSPLIYYHDQPNKIWFAGDRLIPGTLFTYGLWKNKIDNGALPESKEIDFANGAGMLVKRKVFESVGLFDEHLFMYGEEVDFCWRAKMKNFRIISATRAKMWHEVSASTSKTSDLKIYLKAKNQTIFYKRYTNGLKQIYMLSINLFMILIKSIGYLLSFNLIAIRSITKGYLDGLRSNEANL